jgi:hypothetical protein
MNRERSRTAGTLSEIKSSGGNMEFFIDKKTYLKIESSIYDKLIKYNANKYIPNIELDLPEINFLSKPPKEHMHRRYTYNIPQYLSELNYLRGSIYTQLMYCCAYNDYSKDLLSIRESSVNPPKECEFYGNVKYVERERFLKITLYDLYSYREKMSLLIYSITNRTIYNGKFKNVTFKEIEKRIKKLTHENCDWLTVDDVKLLKEVVADLNNDSDIKEVNELRHAYMHRINPGIDCLSTRIHSFNQISDKTASLISQVNNIPIEISRDYIGMTKKPVEKEMNFDDLIVHILRAWRVYAKSLKLIVDNIEIVNSLVNEVYFENGTFDFG